MKSIQMTIPVKLTIFLAIVFLIITYVSIEIKFNELAAQKEQLTDKLDSVNETIDALQNKLDTPFDEEYIIALAKEKLNYCEPDEIIFYNDLIG